MPRTALIVDDSATMREMVAFTLKNAGFDVLQSGNGKEALASLDANPVAIVITDLNMPVMNGIDFIKQMRTRPKHKFTPVLMLTTESQPVMVQAGKAAGATGWITKPFNPAQLVAAIGKVLP